MQTPTPGPQKAGCWCLPGMNAAGCGRRSLDSAFGVVRSLWQDGVIRGFEAPPRSPAGVSLLHPDQGHRPWSLPYPGVSLRYNHFGAVIAARLIAPAALFARFGRGVIRGFGAPPRSPAGASPLHPDQGHRPWTLPFTFYKGVWAGEACIMPRQGKCAGSDTGRRGARRDRTSHSSPGKTASRPRPRRSPARAGWPCPDH